MMQEKVALYSALQKVTKLSARLSLLCFKKGPETLKLFLKLLQNAVMDLFMWKNLLSSGCIK